MKRLPHILALVGFLVALISALPVTAHSVPEAVSAPHLLAPQSQTGIRVAMTLTDLEAAQAVQGTVRSIQKKQEYGAVQQKKHMGKKIKQFDNIQKKRRQNIRKLLD